MGMGWFVFLGDKDKHIVNDIYLVHKPELKNISEEQIEVAYKEFLEKLKKINDEVEA